MIVRTPRAPGTFYQATVSSARDRTLSYGARGLLGFVLSHTDDWIIRVPYLIAGSDKEQEDAVYTLLNELGYAGYLERLVNRTKGKFGPADYVAFEEPAADRAAAWAASAARKSGKARAKAAQAPSDAPPAPPAPPTPAPAPVIDLAPFIAAFNANIEKLPPAASLNDKQEETLRKVIEIHGDDALQLLIDATRWVDRDEYWQKKQFSLGTLVSKIPEKAAAFRNAAPSTAGKYSPAAPTTPAKKAGKYSGGAA